MSRKIAVIGGGVAGLAAAFEAADAGANVTLLEMAPHLGGRAAGGTSFDTGRHLVSTAYTDFLWLTERIGSLNTLTLIPQQYGILAKRRVLWWQIGSMAGPGLSLLASPLLPLNVRFSSLPVLLKTLRAAPAEPTDDELAGQPGEPFPALPSPSVAERLAELGWPRKLYERIGEPVAIGMLNAQPEEVSFAPYLAALKRVFADPERKSGWVRGNCGNLLTDPAPAALESTGVRVLLSTRVSSVNREGDGWRIESDGSGERFDAVIIALPLNKLTLLENCREAEQLVEASQDVGGKTIVTCRGHFNDIEAMPGYFADSSGERAIWFAEPHPEGGVLVERVISGLPEEWRKTPAEMIEDFTDRAGIIWRGARPVKTSLRWYPLATPTLRPGLRRPTARIAEGGLYYASDASATGLPATLESAARAGRLAGRLASSEV